MARSDLSRMLISCAGRVASALVVISAVTYILVRGVGIWGKLTTWEGGMRAPQVVRWPGHIRRGTILDELFARRTY